MRNLNNDLDQNGSKIEFYEEMFRSGAIKKGGSAYERLQELKGTTEDEKVIRLRKFLHKHKEKKKNGS